MSKPIFQDIFAFRGRRNRQSYFLYSAAVWGITVFLYVIVFAAGANASAANRTVLLLVTFLYLVPMVVSSLAVQSQRCRDIGWSGWSVLLFLVPVVGFIFAIALLFVPGTLGDNPYGPDPLEGSSPAGPSGPGSSNSGSSNSGSS